jgi:hypothetical protein
MAPGQTTGPIVLDMIISLFTASLARRRYPPFDCITSFGPERRLKPGVKSEILAYLDANTFRTSD